MSYNIVESQPWLHHITPIVFSLFADRGYTPLKPPQFPPLNVKMMTTDYLRAPGVRKIGYPRSPNFDASALLSEYKDHSWTTEVPLERICLSQFGVKDVIRQGQVIRTGYRDVAAAYFPGMFQDMDNAEHSTDAYVKAAKCNQKKQPLMPRVIPSSTPV